MITEKKVSIYEHYNGFLEGYIFKNGDLPNDEFELKDWSIIDELIGDMILLESGNISSDFKTQIENFIKSETENNIVINHLKMLARRRNNTPVHEAK